MSDFTITPAKPTKLDPANSPWFWNPGRIGIKFAPADFMKKVREIDNENRIEIVWNPIRERWQVFARDYNINRPICQGWRLVFVVEWDNQYVPLDERTLAVLWDRSAKNNGDLIKYWQRVESEMERDRAKNEANRAESIGYGAAEYFDYTKIKNIGKGSKFSDFQSGN